MLVADEVPRDLGSDGVGRIEDVADVVFDRLAEEVAGASGIVAVFVAEPAQKFGRRML